MLYETWIACQQVSQPLHSGLTTNIAISEPGFYVSNGYTLYTEQSALWPNNYDSMMKELYMSKLNTNYYCNC